MLSRAGDNGDVPSRGHGDTQIHKGGNDATVGGILARVGACSQSTFDSEKRYAFHFLWTSGSYYLIRLVQFDVRLTDRLSYSLLST